MQDSHRHRARSRSSGEDPKETYLLILLTGFLQTILDVRPECNLCTEASYMIAGGLGGIGRNIAQ